MIDIVTKDGFVYGRAEMPVEVSASPRLIKNSRKPLGMVFFSNKEMEQSRFKGRLTKDFCLDELQACFVE